MMLEVFDGPLPGWYRQAACVGMPLDVFFPEGPGSSSTEAEAVCGRCPVQTDCGAYAASERLDYGVWGGRDQSRREVAQRAA